MIQAVKSLLRLEFRARYSGWVPRSFGAVLKTVCMGLFGLLMYTLYIGIANNIVEMFFVYDMSYQFLVLFLSIAETVLLFSGISSVNKNLYHSGDNELLLRFPVSGTEVFISKIVVLLANQLIYTALLMLPVFIRYGVLNQVNAWFYVQMLPVILLSVLIPFLMANLLAIPAMYISTQFRNKFLFILIVMVLSVAIGFGVYMLVIQNIMTYMESQNVNMFSDRFIGILDGFIVYLAPARQLTNLMLGNNFWMSLLVIVLILGVISTGAIWSVRRLYMKTVLKNVEISGSSFKRVSKNKERGIFGAIIHREFLDIFRSTNYSFQYLAMAVAEPVMVYFCNSLASAVGTKTVGESILPGLSLLVILIFTSIIISFAASSVSREGDNFYFTKIIPVPYKTQMLVKLALYLLVGVSSVLITTIVLVSCGYIKPIIGLIIFFTATLFTIAETCIAVMTDVRRPAFPIGGDGELTDGNVSTFVTLFIGFLIAVIMGVFAMVGNFLWKPTLTFGITAGIALLMAGVTVPVFFKTVDSRYERIMHR